jgi:hypothetical protein
LFNIALDTGARGVAGLKTEGQQVTTGSAVLGLLTE